MAGVRFLSGAGVDRGLMMGYHIRDDYSEHAMDTICHLAMMLLYMLSYTRFFKDFNFYPHGHLDASLGSICSQAFPSLTDLSHLTSLLLSPSVPCHLLHPSSLHIPHHLTTPPPSLPSPSFALSSSSNPPPPLTPTPRPRSERASARTYVAPCFGREDVHTYLQASLPPRRLKMKAG